MRIVVIWLLLGEITFLLVAPPSVLRASYAKAHVAPHPRGAVIVGMIYCILVWPIFAFGLIVGALCAIMRGFRGVV